MPELPEVETVRRRLAPVLEGRALRAGRDRRPAADAAVRPGEVARELEGERVALVDRRGKYLIVRFESGRALLVHLRMTGSFRHLDRRDAARRTPHRRAVVTLDDGSDVAYRDVRRFGTWLLLEPGEVEPYLDARVGPEPLGARIGRSDLARAARRTAARRSRRRSSTSARSRASGTSTPTRRSGARGSIRCTPARSLDADEVKALHRAIRASLELGIARQGSTLRDYRLPDGERGRMQHEFKVYGRGGRAVRPLRHADRARSASPAAAPGTARRCQRARRGGRAVAPL